jgi:hypothetical protein
LYRILADGVKALESTTMRHIITAVVVAVVAAVSTAAAPQPASRPTFLAIVRADGAMTPIAIYDGREWWNRWPWAGESDEEVRAIALPDSLSGVPADWLPPGSQLPAAWRWQRPDGSMRPIRALRPFRSAEFDLMSTILLRTDLGDSAVSRDHMYHFEPLGVAIAGPGELGRFVPAPPERSTRILESLRPRLDAIEKEAIAVWRKGRELNAPDDKISLTRTYRDPDDERQSPFGLTSIERPFDGRYYHFLSGTKLYNLGLANQPDCKVNVSFEGVVVTRADGSVISEQVSAGAYDGYCGDAAGWLEPLATLRLNGRLLWICRYSVEDGYDYLVFAPDASEPVIELKGQWQLRQR